MYEIDQVLAGAGRSLILTNRGAYVWGNVRSVRVLPANLDEGALCVTNGPAVGHWRYAQDIPQRLNPQGMQWDGVADAMGQLVAWSQGQVFQFAPQVVREHGAAFVQAVELPGPATKVWAAEQVAYAVLESGGLFAWGDGGYGRLGVPGSEGGRRKPAQVKGPSFVRQMSIGTAHTVALDAKGQVWAWGANASGQLGQGDLSERSMPVKVKLPYAVTSIAAGATHSLALDVQGRLWGWGSNHHQQLGTEASAYTAIPLQMELQNGEARLQALGAGMHFSVAMTRGGEVLSWGWNGLGQLGRNPELSGRSRRVELPPVRQISVGSSHVLALTRDGECWAWGDNRFAACQGAAGERVQSLPHKVELNAIDFDSAAMMSREEVQV